MALCVAERSQVRCDYAKFILESLIEANLKNSAKNKLYMNAGPMLTRVAYQALDMIDDLPAASSQASLIQQAKYVPKAVRTTSSAASSRSTRSKKSSNEEEGADTDKEQDSQESAEEDVPKEVEVAGPSEYERSDEEDTSTPLEKRSQKPRSREQVLMDKAMARVEARRKELADARAAKAAKTARIEAEKKVQEEVEAIQAAQTQEKEVIDLNGTVEYPKKIERERHTAEQRTAPLAREKIKEALSRKAKEPVLEPTQGSPKRPRKEDEEELEHIQADPIPPSSINIPPAPPSSPITPFSPASTPRTPPSPSPLNLPKSPHAPTPPQQQHFSAEQVEIPTSLQEETAQPLDKTKEEEKQTDSEQHKPAHVNLQIPIIQLDEPTNEEAVQEVKNFDYTKLIQTLLRQFKCQQVVAKEIDFLKDRANKAHEEITNLRIALELVTQERDSNAKENENLLRDLIDLQSHLTRKEAQNHELIKNEKKMKEQLKYEDARFQKLTASYNTIKTTLTAILQNQEPASAPSTSDSAAANTLAALQEELQTEKLQRQLLVSGFMSQTVQHEAKVKQLELELAQAKADLEAVGSLASTSQIHQAKTHLHIQQPLMPEMPKFQSPEEEEQPRLAPGALDIREQMEQEVEDMSKGPAKEYLLYEGCTFWRQDVLEIDAWMQHFRGKRKAFGPGVVLAHYISTLLAGEVVIVHAEYSPNGRYNLFALQSLSRTLCLSTLAQSANMKVPSSSDVELSHLPIGGVLSDSKDPKGTNMDKAAKVARLALCWGIKPNVVIQSEFTISSCSSSHTLSRVALPLALLQLVSEPLSEDERALSADLHFTG
ncbi:hypothetical protein L7F22_060235 [Adiantum nelumboides]|nr:hypothetical protein [Adiantum nelumboides]